MDDGFDKLRDLLKDQTYPSPYLFKFIVKKDFEFMIGLKNCFDETAEFEKHPSRNGNWISLSIKQMMLSTEDIIDRYKLVQKFDNVIAL
ncbi:MAG: DUF493 family protein [Crocinitomicaceae bacterium]|nr:DUF493 family protein [Crocinitomicaceae bacterium]